MNCVRLAGEWGGGGGGDGEDSGQGEPPTYTSSHLVQSQYTLQRPACRLSGNERRRRKYRR